VWGVRRRVARRFLRPSRRGGGAALPTADCLTILGHGTERSMPIGDDAVRRRPLGQFAVAGLSARRCRCISVCLASLSFLAAPSSDWLASRHHRRLRIRVLLCRWQRSLFVATGHLHGLVHQRDWYRSGARDGDGRPTHRVRAAALPDSVAADVATAAQDGAFRTHGALNSGTKCAVLPLGAPRRSILKTAHSTALPPLRCSNDGPVRARRLEQGRPLTAK